MCDRGFSLGHFFILVHGYSLSLYYVIIDHSDLSFDALCGKLEKRLVASDIVCGTSTRALKVHILSKIYVFRPIMSILI